MFVNMPIEDLHASIYISGYYDYQEPVSIWMLLTFLYFVNEKLSNNMQRNKIHKKVENVK